MSDGQEKTLDTLVSLNSLLLTTDLATITNKLNSNRRFRNEIRKLKRILDTLDHYFGIFDDNVDDRTTTKINS